MNLAKRSDNECGRNTFESEAIRSVMEQVDLVAPTSATVLLLGETGVGKGVLAQMIHDTSPRRHHPMLSVSCAAMPRDLMESELFGRERGAFTGAVCRQVGRFEAAHRSTLFLDEIGELPLDMQVKMLRVLQERTIERLGSNHPIKIDVRIVAATNRHLEQLVQERLFRADLFYRLNVFPITVPPLRERVSDIPALVWTLVDELSPVLGKRIDAISQDSLEEMQQYSWPGNIRELRNAIERQLILTTGSILTIPVPQHQTPSFSASSRLFDASSRLSDVRAEHIKSVLASCGGRIRGDYGAAQRLGMKPTTLESQMAKMGISRHDIAVLAS